MTATRTQVVIVGAGMSGILMGKRLLEEGVDFVILEKARGLGGTWRDNVYPGIACDVPCHLYSYASEPNPDWSTFFPKGSEILAYLQGCADKWGVTPHIRFETPVKSAAWTGSGWIVEAGAETFEAPFVIYATGFFHHPAMPAIDGIETFKGQIIHTARWPADADIDGKVVGIIGNGSTSAQVTPSIIDRVKKLLLFQRTPQWIHPAEQRAHSEEERAAFRRSPIIQRFLADYWKMLGEATFTDAVIGARDATVMDQACAGNLASVEDPALRAALTPDYKPGCKRVVFSSDFYPALQKPNAALVTDPIVKITPTGVETKAGHHPLDTLIFATGFKADAYMRPIKISGADGITLDSLWSQGPFSYRGLALPGFPGLFTLVGPSSPTGNISIIHIAELQSEYILQCIRRMRESGEFWSPSVEATERFRAEIREGQKTTRWVTGCHSYYQGQNGDIVLYPFTRRQFEREMAKPDERDFARTRPLARA
jgi:cation diffusion facilitator CzcD-associated flavoprotein CzcO